MADTIPAVQLVGGVWKDINTATGIAVGTKLILVVVATKSNVISALKTTEPVDNTASVPLPSPSSGESSTVTAGESRCWAYSGQDAVLSVQED